MKDKQALLWERFVQTRKKWRIILPIRRVSAICARREQAVQLKTNGIILKQRNIGENDRIVTVLTQDMA